MTRLILGVLIGVLLSFAAHSFAQFGHPPFDERVKNWNERKLQQRQERLWPTPVRPPC